MGLQDDDAISGDALKSDDGLVGVSTCKEV
jgi:hypothetical protein